MTAIEDVRKFWDSRPCNVAHGTAPVGSRAWSQQITTRKYFVEPHIPGFAQFERWRGKKVLEIGTGIGTDTLEFARRGATIETIDLSMESLKLAWARFKHESVMASFTCCNAERNLPFRPNADGTFDLAYSFGVLHHTPHPERVLENMFACLKPGGELRVMLYAKWSIKVLLKEQPEAQAGCPIARTYTAKQARRLIERSGFKVESIRKDHIFPYVLADYQHHMYNRRWPYRLMSRSLFAWLERRLGHHLLIVARKA
jgi:ubiquinone/menaquinone biosynthesis C-methylase UbiE